MAGIYVTTKLSSDSCSKLRSFVESLPLPEGSRMGENKYHITLAYSKEGFEYKHNEAVNGTEAKPFKWEIFGEEGGRVLVLRVESEVLQQRYQQLCAQGYKNKFPDYKPHITVALGKDVNPEKLPLPGFSILVEYEYSEPLDEDYSYDPKTMVEAAILTFRKFFLRCS